VHSYGWKAIEKRRATENWEEIKDLLTILLTSVDSETGEKMPDDQIARELGAFIAAGHETSAHSTKTSSPQREPVTSRLSFW
jgi:cytochrome P450